MLRENLRSRLSHVSNQIMGWLEPDDVYDQAYLPVSFRSFRMRLSDTFYLIFKWLIY